MIFKYINKFFRDLLTVIRLRKKKILVLNNHPTGYSDTIGDFKRISQLRNTCYRDPKLCSTIDEFARELKKGYDIVHVSVHGTRNALELSDLEHNVKHDIITRLFQDNIYTKLVFLNVCFSEKLAVELARFVPFVIGWSNNTRNEEYELLCDQFYLQYVERGNSIISAFKIAAGDMRECHLHYGTKKDYKDVLISVLKKAKGGFIAFLLGLIILPGMLLFRSLSSPDIIAPDQDTTIINVCDVVISAPLLGKGSKLWVFVGTPGYKDVWWPQGTAEKIEGKWKISVICGNVSDYGDYKICAMVVNPSTDQDLKAWINSQYGNSPMAPLGELPPDYSWHKSDIIKITRINVQNF